MPPTDPELTPAQERAVRARLAAARHDEPVPDDVAARLDATLASLVADREGTGQATDTGATGRVVELRSRRRKAVAGLLAAAAVVVVGGVVSGQILGDQVSLSVVGGSAESSGGSDSAAEDSGGDAASPERGARGRDRAGADGIEDPTLTDGYRPQSGAVEELAGRGAPTVDPDAFAADAARLRELGRVSATTRDGAAYSKAEACSVSAGRGRRVLVTYEGQPGVLVYREPEGGDQQVELHLCGSLAPRRTAQIPAP